MHTENEPQSKRDAAMQRRKKANENRVLKDDTEANAGVNVAIGAMVVILVVFVVWDIIQQRAVRGKAKCEVEFADDAAGELDCKDQIDTNMTIAGVIMLIALLTGGGLYANQRRQGGFRRRGRGA